MSLIRQIILGELIKETIDPELQDHLNYYIGETIKNQFKELNLSGYRIDEIPPQLFQATQIEILNCSNNNIKEIPEEIGNLQNLKELYLNDNQLTALPESIKKNKWLKSLELKRNNLQTFPNLSHILPLNDIDVRDNQLTQLPQVDYSNINILIIKGNPIKPTIEQVSVNIKRKKVFIRVPGRDGIHFAPYKEFKKSLIKDFNFASYLGYPWASMPLKDFIDPNLLHQLLELYDSGHKENQELFWQIIEGNYEANKDNVTVE